MRKFFAFLVIPVFIFCTGVSAFGGTASSSMIVSTTIVPGCSVTTNPLSFGQVSNFDPGPPVSTSIVAKCPDQTSYSISINGGQHLGQLGKRGMAMPSNEANRITYTIYWDALGGSEPGDPGYGDTYPNGSLKTDIGNGLDQTHTIVGVIAGGAFFNTAPTGEYQDEIIVSVHF